MAGPYITIDLAKITHNARTITRLCAQHGIEVTGVTKGTCGLPEVARAMLCGGVVSVGMGLGYSRFCGRGAFRRLTMGGDRLSRDLRECGRIHSLGLCALANEPDQNCGHHNGEPGLCVHRWSGRDRRGDRIESDCRPCRSCGRH